ncbi:MAG: ABC transporter ATP-binding protein [Proteobacteria bacterium]|nr:ABC transporter ATP-binding protein [Pseudomonadota bacterium]
MSDELIRVEGLCKSFEMGDTRIDVLSGLDLRIRRGETVAVVGQSGVGKTTLLQILGTLDHPTSGSVHLDGEEVFTKNGAELARLRSRSLGFVFQFHHLLPEFDSLENVMMPGLIAGVPAAEMRGRAMKMLEEVGLAHRITHPIGKLSGGERQRVAVARALVMDPPLVLADEPTGNLDPTIGDQIAELLLEMNRTRGTTLVVATHSERMAQKLGRTLVLSEGRLDEPPPTPA